MKEKQLNTLVAFFKTLAHESRLKILGLLSSKERSVEELAALLQLKESTISHHLAKMKEMDLVTMTVQGNTHLYHLHNSALETLQRDIFSLENISALATNIDSSNWQARVLKNFISDNRLIKIPSSHKKLLVILEWLAQQFAFKIRYPEARVNQILKRFHPDCATLRRELIGNGFMQRQRNVYWRLK